MPQDKKKKPSRPNKSENPYRLLTEDLLSKLKLGWEEVPGLPPQTRMNRKGWGILWLAVLRGQSGYDRPQFLESPCVMVVIKDGHGRIAFVKTPRTHRLRLMGAANLDSEKSYIARLIDDKLFERLVAEPATATESTELPAGIVDPEDFVSKRPAKHPLKSYRNAIKRAAKREAEEETGLKVKIVETFVDFTNPNPAWFLHPQSVAVAKLVHTGKQKLDETEGPKQLVWYTHKQIRRLVRRGEIFDSRTVHALVLAGVELH